MIGIDIIEIKRIKKIIKEHGNRFLQKIFTEKEIKYCEQFNNKYERYAARFAAKEAIAKVIKDGPGNFWLDMEIQNQPNGAPYVILSERLQQIIKKPIEISLSHCHEYAVGVAYLT